MIALDLDQDSYYVNVWHMRKYVTFIGVYQMLYAITDMHNRLITVTLFKLNAAVI